MMISRRYLLLAILCSCVILPARALPDEASRWHLIRSGATHPTTAGSSNALALAGNADVSSDTDFVGMMLRCASPRWELIAVLLSPLHPNSKVTVALNGMAYDASIASPGTAVRLAAPAANRLIETGRASKRLEVKIDSGGRSIAGAVEMTGFEQAYRSFASECDESKGDP